MPLDLDTVEASVAAHPAPWWWRPRTTGTAASAAEIAAAMQESLFGELDAPVLRVGAAVRAGAAQPGAAGRADPGGRRRRAAGP